MTILVRFKFLPHNDKYQEIREFFRNILPGTRKYPGNKGVILSIDDANSEKLMLIEYWKSQADFIKYLNWRLEKGDLGKLESMLIEEMSFKLFNVIDDCYLP